MSRLELVAFDADDTLWHNLIHFEAAEQAFGEMFANYIPAADAARLLQQAEMRNLKFYGFGVKSFTLSMIEVANEITGGALDGAMISKLLQRGRDMLDHDVEILPHVEDTLKELHKDHKLLLITKGDLFHQERKVLASGLAHYFEGVEIVSDKKAQSYLKICKRYGGDISRSLMAGNSIKSDVLPMIEAGGHGIYVPFEVVWEHEHEEVPYETPRFHEVQDIRGVVDVVRALG